MDNLNTNELIKIFLAPKTFGLVGASDNPEKYGNIILKNLTAKGYNVLPINPTKETIEGIKCYKDILSLPSYVKFLNFVIPPPKALSLLPQALEKKIEIIWFQPGAYDDKVIAKCKELGLKSIHDGSCIMVCSTVNC